jgi:Fe-S-cluster-containing dehydrogenase component/formate-dependent nitrite reductase membrane component NrfD
MTKYAFVIDQRKCIGCHACTVACKAEHDVPIGVYRTWVKYIEKGAFPNTRRYFLVNRCNHCDDAPCVKICPTRALYKRSDGIVDFDASRCIGCKSCMQACPYDALYIDPASGTAAKCNYCAHRTELGLEPACVVVCPERAIIAGDLQDPTSQLAKILAREPVRTRKPEQGTGPNVYYLGAEEAAIDPELADEGLAHMTMWSTLLQPGHTDERAINPARSLQPPASQSRPAAGAHQPASAARAHVVYDTPKNTAPWGWRVSTYLATKSIGAGAPLVAAPGLALYGTGGAVQGLFGSGAAILGGFFLACTLLLLVADLKRPERVLYLLTKANPTSWLVWGGYLLALCGLLEAAWFCCALLGQFTALRWLLAPTALCGAGVACYTAFLFGQAEGRDFWQGPLLLPILFVQAVLAGSATLGILALALHSGSEPVHFLTLLLLLAVLLHAALVLCELYGPHPNRHVAQAARYIGQGRLRMLFWPVCIGAGTLLPVALLVTGLALPAAQSVLLALAALFVLPGLLVYEQCFVKAGQVVPLS